MYHRKINQDKGIYASQFIIEVQHWKISNLKSVGPHKGSVLILGLEVLHSLYLAIAVSVRLIKDNTNIKSSSEVYNSADECNLSSGPALDLAPRANTDSAGQFAHIIRIMMPSCHSLFLLEQFRVVLHLILLPLPEVFRQVVVILLTDHVLLHAFKTFNFLVNGRRVEIEYIEDHAGCCAVRPQGSHVLVHVSDQNALWILELQPREGDDRSKPHFYVLLDGQNRLVEVVARLDDLERADVVLDGQFDGGVLHQCLHLKIFKLYLFPSEQLMQEQSTTRPTSADKLAPRELLREQLILQKFLKHLNNNTLPTLHDDNALKVTRIQNQLLEENIAAFREGRYEAYLAGKVQALRKEVEEKSKIVNSKYSY